MAPGAIVEPFSEADIVRTKNAPTSYRNDGAKNGWKKPVTDDYMYHFKYNFDLPTHDKHEHILDFTAEEEQNVHSIAEQYIENLSEIIQSKDSEAFSELFLDIGTWKDKITFTWDYRSFNTPSNIKKAAADLFARTPTNDYKLIEPTPAIQRHYHDIAWLQIAYSFNTDIVGASGLLNLIKTTSGYKIWTLHTAIESLIGHAELPNRDGHMKGDKSWHQQRMVDDDLEDVEPEVIIIGGGHNGLHMAARLKALGVSALIIERNQRIGDNWRKRYEYLSLHFPHWGDHFPYFPFPNHWPTYTPAGKMGDWLEWYASAMELTAWTDSHGTEQKPSGEWEITVQRGSQKDSVTRVFHPKQVVMATSLAGVPYIPEIPGMDTFKGTIRHSTAHDSSREWIGKKVLVVGTSSSGFDTAYDFARRGIDVTLLQRSATYLMTLDNSVPRLIAPLYAPKNGKRPDIETADRVHFSMPMGPSEEMARRVAKEIWDDDAEMLAKMEKAGFMTWRGQRDTGVATLGHTKNGGFYYEAGACQAIIDGKIKVERGFPVRFNEDTVILDGEREQKFDLVILATGFSNTIDSVRKTLGDDVANRCNPIWGVDEEGEINGAWRSSGVDGLWIMVGTFHQGRYHSKKMALRIKAILEGIAPEPYLK